MRLSYFNSSVIYVAEIRHLTKSNLGEEKIYFTGCSPSLKELKQELEGSPACFSIQYDFLSKKKLWNTLLAS